MQVQTNFILVTKNGKRTFSGPGLAMKNQGGEVVTINRHLELAPGEIFHFPEVSYPAVDTTHYEFKFQGGRGEVLIIERAIL